MGAGIQKQVFRLEEVLFHSEPPPAINVLLTNLIYHFLSFMAFVFSVDCTTHWLATANEDFLQSVLLFLYLRFIVPFISLKKKTQNFA